MINNFAEFVRNIDKDIKDGFNKGINNFSPICIENEPVAAFEIDRSLARNARWLNNFISKEKRNDCNLELLVDNNYRTFVIILESPHINEFEKNRKKNNPDDNYGNHPAMGKTGININRFFLDYINKFIPTINKCNKSISDSKNDILPGKYCLYLINAIRFQCSLGQEKKRLKNKVFRKCFEDVDEKEFFKNYLANIKPSVVLNACTSNFKNLIWKTIDELNVDDVVMLESYHPSAWTNNICICTRTLPKNNQ